MGANHGAVEHELLVVRIACQVVKNPLPDAGFGPSGETLMHGFVFAVTLRQVMPMRA
jgi:hypothetical protein